MSELLSITASLFMVAVVVSYFLQVRSDVSTPNPATWLIWSIVSIMNSFSYFSVVQGDMFKFFLTVISATGLTIIFFYALRTGKFGKPGWTEIISFTLALVIGIIWRTTGNTILANLSLQLVLVISFYPTISGLIRKELREKPLPWVLAVIAQFFQIASIILDWQTSGGWPALAYPILNGVMGNGSVAVIIYYQIRQRKQGL
ncbi:hypothetical protein HOB10_01990 [Candidatus Parcubacteria bacterium]|jgi:hypothetical protein|nr:hypothetical protein [Candidatus Parcubacteria bacterium]